MIRDNSIADNASVIALRALAWILGDDQRTSRLLALTGLDGDQLRRRLQEPSIHLAVLDYLMGHEPDLVACAETLGIPSVAIATAHRSLSL